MENLFDATLLVAATTGASLLVMAISSCCGFIAGLILCALVEPLQRQRREADEPTPDTPENHEVRKWARFAWWAERQAIHG